MSKTVISFLVPTRGRPAFARRFLDSVVSQTVHLDQVEVILYADDDDTSSHSLGDDRFAVTRIIGPQRTMGEYNSACLAAARGDILILANDDMVIGTRGWDERLVSFDASIPDKIYLAYCNDLYKKDRVCTFPVLSRRACELLSDPYPSSYRGSFIDSHLLDIFKRLQHAGFNRIHYLEDVIFEHMHYRAGKAPIDDTYRRRVRFGDDWTFLGLKESRRQTAAFLIDVLEGRHPAPYVPPRDFVARAPDGMVNAFAYISKQLLRDRSAPLRWRSYLWVYFLGRHLAARGMLRPFVR